MIYFLFRYNIVITTIEIMKRKIIRIGNSYGIIIPKNIFKIMDWDVNELEVTINTNKKEMVIKKASGK